MRAVQNVSLSKQVFSLYNPFVECSRRYKNFIATTDHKVAYITRNDKKIVTPFLDGLRCKFIMVHQIVLVCADSKLPHTLELLNFRLTADVLPKTREFAKIISAASLKDYERWYNEKYGIEVHCIPTEHWQVATTANHIVNNLRIKEELQVTTFCSVYNTLLGML